MSISASLLAQAQAAADDRDDKHARELLSQLVAQQPKNTEAWILFSVVAEGIHARTECARQAMLSNPSSYAAWDNAVTLLDEQQARELLVDGTPMPAALIAGPRLCPFCAEDVKAAAIVCKHCGRNIPPETIKAKQKAQSRKDMNTLSGSLTQIGCTAFLLAAMVFIVIPMVSPFVIGFLSGK